MLVDGARWPDLSRRLREDHALVGSVGAIGGGRAPTLTCFLPYVFHDAATVMKFRRGGKSALC